MSHVFNVSVFVLYSHALCFIPPIYCILICPAMLFAYSHIKIMR